MILTSSRRGVGTLILSAFLAAIIALAFPFAAVAADPLPILGYVRDYSGRPIAGAEIVLINEGGEDSGSSARTLSTEDGLFQFTNMPEGIYSIHVTADGFLAQQDTIQMTRETRRVINFTLTGSRDPEPEAIYLGKNVGAVRGTVVCDETDEPVADAVITIGEAFITTNDAGSFRLKDLGVGERRLKVIKNGFEKFEKDILVKPKEQNLVIRINKSVKYSTVDGRVRIRRKNGRDCPPIKVYLAGKVAVTDFRGTFRFENIREGSHPLILIYDKREIYNDIIKVRRGITVYEIIVDRL